MIVAVADTHAVIWNLFDDKRLSQTARDFIENAAAGGNLIAISSITLAEIVYLTEKERIPVDTLSRVLGLLVRRNSPVIEAPVDREICQQLAAIPRVAIPDLPDRIIAATAQYLNVPVISRDRKILTSGLATIW
ncbi:MAG: type II toxin-antitoxin system VapC family toxin [Chloroflexi bacterium]|nr:type II toxin-antitoxin system VapC family toxin [Chloroflexota bacterium]